MNREAILTKIIEHKSLVWSGAFVFLFIGFFAAASWGANTAQASVAFDASSESHTGTTGSVSQSSFSWTHTPVGTPKGVLIFVWNDGTAAQTTSITYGGVNVPAVSGGAAVDTAGETGRMTAFYLGSGLPTGAQTVTVNRNNNTTELWAVAITITATGNTQVYEPGIVLVQEDGTLAVQSVTDGSPGTNSLRFAGAYSGLASPPAAGTGSTLLQNFDTGNFVGAVVRETTAGQGARNVGVSSGTADDRAAVHLAVREVPNITISGTCDGFDRTTDCTDDGSNQIAVYVNGALAGTDSVVDGSWSVAVSMPASGSSILVYVNSPAANASRATAITKYDGSGNVDLIRLYQETLTIGTDTGSANSGQTLTDADMDDWDGNFDIDIVYRVLTSGLCIGQSSYSGLCLDARTGRESLLILAGNTLVPASNVSAHDTEIKGTFTGSSNRTYTVSGSWTNHGTFTASTSIVTFTSTAAGETILSDGSDFYQVMFIGSGGGWTLQDDMTVAYSMSLNAGTLNGGTGNILTFSGAGLVGTPFNISGSGAFSPGTSTIIYSGNYAPGNTGIANTTYYDLQLNNGLETFALSGATTVQNNLTIGSGATLSAGSNTLTIGGNFDVDGSFDESTGTVIFNDSGKTSVVTSNASAGTTVADSYSEANYDINVPIWDNGIDSPFEIGQSFTGNGGVLNKAQVYIRKVGTFVGGVSASIYSHSGVYGTSSIPATLIANSNNFYTVDELSGTMELKDFDFTGQGITLQNGTNYILVLTANGGNGSEEIIYVGVDSSSPSHTGNSSVNTIGVGWAADAQDLIFYVHTGLASNLEFNNLTVNTPGKTVQFEANKTFQVNGALSVTGSSGSLVTFTSTDSSNPPTTNWVINHQGTESITYLSILYGSCYASSTDITMGTGSTVDINSGSCWKPPFTGISVSGHLYSDQGVTPLTGVTVGLRVNGGSYQSFSFIGEEGEWGISSVPADVGDVLTIYLDGVTQNATTISVSNGANVTDMDLYQNTLIVRYASGSSITNATLNSYDNTDEGDGDIVYTSDGTNLTLNSGTKLLVWTGKTYNPGGSVTATGDLEIQSGSTMNMAANSLSVGGNVTNSGTLVAPSTTMTINGNLTNNGTFTNNGGTVVIAPTATNKTSIIGGSANITFNNLTNTTISSIIKFAHGRTYTFAGTMTATATNGKRISLKSDLLGSQWTITFNNQPSFNYVNVQDSACSGGLTLTLNRKLYDQGNNGSCWYFLKRGGGNGSSGAGPGSSSSGSGSGGADGTTAQATATATVSGGAVVSVQVTNSGAGYITSPLVCFVDDVSVTETGAAGTAVMSGGTVASITVDSGGTGYTSATTVVIRAPGMIGGTCAAGSGDGGAGGGAGGSP
jgi:hypothetical protein